MDLENKKLTDGQREHIYQKMLVPIKAKISQIILYDTEAALNFLQKYNEIVKNEEKLGMNLVQEIANLEFEIQEYESSKGKQELKKEQSKSLLGQIAELEAHYEQLSTQDFDVQFVELKNQYENNLQDYSFDARDTLESKVHALQAALIMRKVNDEPFFDMNQIIPKEDEAWLTMFINEKLNQLMQDNSSKCVKKLKNKVLNGEDFIHDAETWRLMDMAQRELISQEQTDNQITTMPAVIESNTRGTNSLIGKMFGKSVQIGEEIVKAKDLAKIDMTWLANHMSVEDLKEIEEKKLDEKDRRYLKEMYIPDARTPIYDFFEKEKRKRPYRDLGGKYEFYTEQGGAIGMKIKYNKYVFYTDDSTIEQEVRFYDDEEAEKIVKVIDYSDFISSTIGGNCKQELLNEIGIFLHRCSYSRDWMNGFDIIRLNHLLPIYNNLARSYDKVETEFEKTVLNFRGIEENRRKKFYKQNEFLNSLIPNKESEEQKESINLQIEDKKNKKKVKNKKKEKNNEMPGESK